MRHAKLHRLKNLNFIFFQFFQAPPYGSKYIEIGFFFGGGRVTGSFGYFLIFLIIMIFGLRLLELVITNTFRNQKIPKNLKKIKKTKKRRSSEHFYDRNRIGIGKDQNLMLIPNLKSEFKKTLKKIPKTKKHDFCFLYFDRNFDQNKIKIFFSC